MGRISDASRESGYQRCGDRHARGMRAMIDLHPLR